MTSARIVALPGLGLDARSWADVCRLLPVDVLTLPGSLEMLGNEWVIGISATLFVIEFVADKIPMFDLVWNALQTFVRVPVGALLGYAATTGLSPTWQAVATAVGMSSR